MTIVFLNSITVMAYWKPPKLKDKVSYFLIMMLSLVDFTVGTIGTSLFTAFLVSKIVRTAICGIFFTFGKMTMLLMGLSISTLSTINIERYMGILHPMIHRSKVTRKKLLISVLFIWMLCSIPFSVPVLERQIANFF